MKRDQWSSCVRPASAARRRSVEKVIECSASGARAMCPAPGSTPRGRHPRRRPARRPAAPQRSLPLRALQRARGGGQVSSRSQCRPSQCLAQISAPQRSITAALRRSLDWRDPMKQTGAAERRSLKRMTGLSNHSARHKPDHSVGLISCLFYQLAHQTMGPGAAIRRSGGIEICPGADARCRTTTCREVRGEKWAQGGRRAI